MISTVRRYGFLVLLLGALVACGGGGGGDSVATPPAQAQVGAKAKTLSVTPVAQQTEQWCWAASAEMIFRYYGLPAANPVDFQCGIVALYWGPFSPCWQDCTLCVQGIGTLTQMQQVVNGYGAVLNQNGVPSRVLSSSLTFSALPFANVVAEIDAGRPVFAGISPSGYAYPNISQHAVLIVGYDNTQAEPILIINDPFPYFAFPQTPNPYFAAGGVAMGPGRFAVSYRAFVSPMNWANTIYNIQ